MQGGDDAKMTRRRFAASVFSTTFLATPALAQTTVPLFEGGEPEVAPGSRTRAVRRNTSSFRTRDWQLHFSNLKNGAILVDTRSRVLHFWSEDGSTYRLYPTSVPSSPELTRLGRTRVVGKVVGPEWRPTESMLQRNPDWPRYVPPGPDNPLGTHALYLSWRYFRIHGTHDPRKIGRRSSNGCIGLYNRNIAELFEMSKVGTQVLLL